MFFWGDLGGLGAGGGGRNDLCGDGFLDIFLLQRLTLKDSLTNRYHEVLKHKGLAAIQQEIAVRCIFQSNCSFGMKTCDKSRAKSTSILI